MRALELWSEYSREEVHSIFSPDTDFVPQAGTWGIQGMVRVPDRENDWVFFVTFGKEQGEHTFDESITEDGVLSWQSQPRYELNSYVIKALIDHDERVSNIHLFLRTNKLSKYAYFGKLDYLTHDTEREKPVYFQWQVMDWPPSNKFLEYIGLQLIREPAKISEDSKVIHLNELLFLDKPQARPKTIGTKTSDFRSRKSPDYGLIDSKNKKLGLEGELLVLAQEIKKLRDANKPDLAERVLHVSVVEGDGAGHDLRSFEVDGTPKFIEIKTTKGSATTPFFISPNELEFSKQHPVNYYLYRLYEFDGDTKTAKAFVLKGDLSNQISLIPTQFKAIISG